MSATERFFAPSLSKQSLASLSAIINRGGTPTPLHTSKNLRDLAIHACKRGCEEHEGLKLAVTASLLADLWEQGWLLSVLADRIKLRPPSYAPTDGETPDTVKARIRSALMIASDRQLATSSVREFIQSMERDRIFRSRIISIRSIIDDGEELAAEIDHLIGDRDASFDPSVLRRVVDPVLQVCDPDANCKFTGLKLQDIWRYFRHTWSLEYNPTPGRTMRFLLRNRARRNWPVMGIAMLASPAANLYARDRWIGWTLESLNAGLLEGRVDANYAAKALYKTVQDAIESIRTNDLLRADEARKPNKQAIFRLEQIAAQAEALRRNDLIDHFTGNGSGLVDIRSLGKNIKKGDWRKLSGTALFRRKRAEQLIPLLRTLQFFQDLRLQKAPAAALYEMLVTRRGCEAVTFVLNEIRKKVLASEVADLSVCGAIQPYNYLLGGKLVALSMMSQEARTAYKQRYSDQPSEIASQLAGREVYRSADLKVVTTTSLYGVGSSQYNRLKLKSAAHPELGADLEWVELEQTEGFTVTHLSRQTVEYMRTLGLAVYGRRRINSVFGEGSSPRTRQVREGLNLIGINHNAVLQQGQTRRVYACELFPTAREALIGLTPKKHHPKNQSMRSITSAWLRRWVVERVKRAEVMAQVRASGANEVVRDLYLRAARGKLVTGEHDDHPPLSTAAE